MDLRAALPDYLCGDRAGGDSVSPGRCPFVYDRGTDRPKWAFESAGHPFSADRRRHSRAHRELLDWEQNRSEAFQQPAESCLQPEASGANARFLRTAWSENDHAFPVRSVDSHLCSVCGRNGLHELPEIFRLQRHWSIRLGLRRRFTWPLFREYPLRAKEFFGGDTCDCGGLDDSGRPGNIPGLARKFESLKTGVQELQNG